MKSCLFCRISFLLSFLFIYQTIEAKPLQLSFSADSAILMNADTGVILFEKNSQKIQYPASTTKIATAFYALKRAKGALQQMVVAEHEAIATLTDRQFRKANYFPPYRLTVGTTHMGIKKGEELKLIDLLNGLMIVSAGDAANVIAQHTSGSIPKFMSELNEYLLTLGCQHTLFKNPHGLHHPEHKTCAMDLAHLTKEAMKDPVFCSVVRTVRATRPETNKQKASFLLQTNRLLKKSKFYYPKAIGVKTGYTSVAQNNLVSAATDGNRTLIAVLMKCPEKEDMYSDTIKLFETAFAEKKARRRLIAKGVQKEMLALQGSSKPLKAYLKEDASLEYYPSEEPNVRCFLKWEELSLPIEKDSLVARLDFQDEKGHVLLSGPLFAFEEVRYSRTFLLLSFVKRHYILLSAFSFIGFFMLLRARKFL